MVCPLGQEGAQGSVPVAVSGQPCRFLLRFGQSLSALHDILRRDIADADDQVSGSDAGSPA